MMSAVACVLTSVEPPAVEELKNSIVEPVPLLVIVEVPAVAVSVNSTKLFAPLFTTVMALAVAPDANFVKLPAPLFVMVEVDAAPVVFALTVKSVDAPTPKFTIGALPALLVSLKSVCVLSPRFVIAALPAVELPKKATTELVAVVAPGPLLLMVAVPAVVVS